jgi:hypothetical protein
MVKVRPTVWVSDWKKFPNRKPRFAPAAHWVGGKTSDWLISE